MKRLLSLLLLSTTTSFGAIPYGVVLMCDGTNTFWTPIAVFVPAITNTINNPYSGYTNVTTKVSVLGTGAGSGSTNYLLTLSTNANNYFYIGGSNVNIYTVAGSTLGSPIPWTAIVTNLSASTWGFTISNGTNRWRWYNPAYGTNRPTVLTNNTALCLNGQSDGTNTLVNYWYFTPGL